MKAIFLGSFNPPHKGHYNVIKSFINSGFMESLGIDKVHIIPCRQNPNKTNYTVSYIARYKMCEMLFRDFIVDRKVVIDDIENEILPDYTYDLIKYFKAGNDTMISKDFWWIITMETLQEIIDGKWFNSEELLNNKFIIMYRENDILYDAIQLLKDDKIDSRSISIKIDNEVDYHSTLLRANVKNGTSIAKETNKDIQEFIEEGNLYK